MSQEERKQKKLDKKIVEIKPLLEEFLKNIVLTYGIKIIPAYSEATISHGVITKMGHFDYLELNEAQIKIIKESKIKEEKSKPQLEII